MKRLLVPMIAIALGISAAFAGFQLLQTLGPRPMAVETWQTIGQIESVSGEVSHRLPRSPRFLSAQPSTSFHSQELLVTGRASEAVVQFSSGTKIKASENTRLIAESDPSRPGVIVLTLLDGSISLLNPGPEGSLRIFHQGQEFNAQDLQTSQVPVLSTNPSATSGAFPNEPSNDSVVSATTPDDSARTGATKPRPMDSTLTSKKDSNFKETLTDDEIIRTIQSQSRLFQRCYLTYIDRAKTQEGMDAREMTGVIHVGFVIQSSGKITNTRVIRSEFEDATLHRCVLEVLERTSFKPFEGETIPIDEFPIALK